MRISIAIVIWLFTYNPVYSQIDSASLSIIEHRLRKHSDTSEIIYADRIPNYFIKNIQTALYTRTFKSKAGDGVRAFTLTKQERDYLIQQITKYQKPFWKDSLFTKSKRVYADSLFVEIKKKNVYKQNLVKLLDNTRVPDSTKLMIIKEIKKLYWAYAFSAPIYLRDKQYFAMFTLSLCGSDCGSDGFAIFKKEQQEWKRWVTIISGEF